MNDLHQVEREIIQKLQHVNGDFKRLHEIHVEIGNTLGVQHPLYRLTLDVEAEVTVREYKKENV